MTVAMMERLLTNSVSYLVLHHGRSVETENISYSWFGVKADATVIQCIEVRETSSVPFTLRQTCHQQAEHNHTSLSL